MRFKGMNEQLRASVNQNLEEVVTDGKPSLPVSDASKPTHCWRLGLSVFAQYFLLALDIRFVASRNYVGIVVANALIAIMGWYVVRGMVEAHSVRERASYVFGGTAGALIAVWVS